MKVAKQIEKKKLGVIYPIVNGIVQTLYRLNIVELRKKLFVHIFRAEEKNNISRTAVDIFVILKWLFVLLGYFLFWHNIFALIFIIYLLFTNIFTYFYYHIRNQKDSKTSAIMKRGFIKIFSAFLFSNLCFSYFYSYRDGVHFSIVGSTNQIGGLLYSFANSLTVGYEHLIVISNYGYVISIFQVFVTLIFVSIFIANSIPRNTK